MRAWTSSCDGCSALVIARAADGVQSDDHYKMTDENAAQQSSAAMCSNALTHCVALQLL
jgi:hypothetical protein